jgi:hypothetical protein
VLDGGTRNWSSRRNSERVGGQLEEVTRSEARRGSTDGACPSQIAFALLNFRFSYLGSRSHEPPGAVPNKASTSCPYILSWCPVVPRWHRSDVDSFLTAAAILNALTSLSPASLGFSRPISSFRSFLFLSFHLSFAFSFLLITAATSRRREERVLSFSVFFLVFLYFYLFFLFIICI